MKKIFLIVSVLTLIFSSCEKNEQKPVYEDFQSSTLLRQIKASENDMQVITYYNSGNVFEHVGLYSYKKYLYNKHNQLTKIEIALSFNPLSCAIIPGETYNEGDNPRKAKINQYHEFEYAENGNIKTKKSYYVNDGITQLTSYSKYEYKKDTIIKIELYNPQDVLTQFHTYLYDNKGNVSEEEYYYMMDGAEPTLQTRTTFEYDEKNNPFKVFHVEGSPGIQTNVNNITLQTNQSFYEGQAQTSRFAFTYEYNDLGFPILVDKLEYIYGKDE